MIGEVGRAAARAVGVALVLTVAVTGLFLLLNTGLVLDSQQRRMDRDGAPAGGFIAIGIATIAVAVAQIGTKRATRTGAITGALLTGPLTGIGIALAVLPWRLVGPASADGSGLWNDYLHDPLGVVLLAVVVWSATNIGMALGFAIGSGSFALSTTAGLALAPALLVAGFGSWWLHRTEPTALLLLLGLASLPLTMAIAAGAVWLRDAAAPSRAGRTRAGVNRHKECGSPSR